MTVLAAIFGTVLMTIYALQTSSRGMTESLADTVQQRRFATQLRTDAHAARGVELAVSEGQDQKETKALLTLDMDDGQQIVYQLKGEEIERQIRSSQSTVHRESYYVSPVVETGWTIDRARAKPLLSVHLHRHSGPGEDAGITLPSMRVDAAVGLNRLAEADAAP
jgi:hypothetical protein